MREPASSGSPAGGTTVLQLPIRSGCRVLLFHRSQSDADGEFRRVSAVGQAITAALDARTTEVALRRLTFEAVRRRNGCAIPNGWKVELPIVLPTLRLRTVRAAGFVAQWLAGFVMGLRVQPDIIIGETHGAHWAVRGAKRASPRAKVLMDIHGAVPEEIEYIFHASAWGRSSVAAANRIEKWVCTHSDIVICQSEAMIEHLRNKYTTVRPPLIEYRCAADLTRFQLCEETRNSTRHRLGFSTNDRVIVYLGTLAKWQMPTQIFRWFASARSESARRARLLMITPADRDAVLRQASAEGIQPEDIVVIKAAADEVPRLLPAGDIGLLPREDVVVNRVASPTKLGEYLACGLPVIVTPVARNWPGVNTSSECFVVHDPQGSSALNWAAVFESLDRNRIGIGQRCRDIAERCYSNAAGYDQLHKHLLTLLPELAPSVST